MPVCAVNLCRNYVGKPHKNNKITFHRFPTDFVQGNRWREIIQQTRINEDEWIPHKTSVVCSDHFTENQFSTSKMGLRRLKKGSVPSKCLFLSATEPESSTNVKQESIEPKPSCSKEPECDDPNTDFSDLESIFDTPREAKLRRKLRCKIMLEKKHRAVINSLRKKNNRLKKQNVSIKCIIKSLKKHRLINEDVYNALKGNLIII